MGVHLGTRAEQGQVEAEALIADKARRPRASLPLSAIRRPRDTPIWKLEASFKCRSCKKGRYAPPVHMIKLTATQESRLTSGCIRMRRGSLRPACQFTFAA
jgi:hypothetical protein